jgi:hypothetical protein
LTKDKDMHFSICLSLKDNNNESVCFMQFKMVGRI